MMNVKFFLILSIFLFLPAGALAIEVPLDLQVITEEYPPLNYEENGTLKGISVDLMEAILQKMGSDINRSSFQLLPWSEGYALAQSRPDTILFSTVRIPEREDLFLWAGPVITERKGLFMLNDSDINGSSDISSLRIAVIKNDSGVNMALMAGVKQQNLIEVPNGPYAVQLLENTTADAWIYGEIAGYQFIQRHARDPSRIVYTKDMGMSEKSFAFNSQTSLEFVQAVNDTLQELKTDQSGNGLSTYEEIIARYLPDVCRNTSPTREQVMDIVAKTAEGIQIDAPRTFEAINSGENPLKDAKNPDLFAYIYEMNGTIPASPIRNETIRENLSVMTDAGENSFRDRMISKARQNGNGWISYEYTRPTGGLDYKTSYYERVTGSDGRDYVVGADRYLNCGE